MFFNLKKCTRQSQVFLEENVVQKCSTLKFATLTEKKITIFKQKHGPSSSKKVHYNLIIISFWLFKDCGADLITVFLQNYKHFV